MTFITGEQLNLLVPPEIPRYQIDKLMDYLCRPVTWDTKVCTLYGFRRAGKTTLIVQAIRRLIRQGISTSKIGYFTGMRGDDIDDVVFELEAHKEIEYVFVDEVSFFSNFLSSGSYFYDTQIRLYGHRVVISGTNLLALYVAQQQTLFDRCEIIRVPYLSFFEHCKFVLNTDKPNYEQFIEYLKYGGLFDLMSEGAIDSYVQSSITDPIIELFDSQSESKLFSWLKPESDSVNWHGIVNTILFLSSNYVSNKHFQEPVSLVEDARVLEHNVTRQIAREFKQYFSLSAMSRVYRMKRTETVALLDFLTHCGAIIVLNNMFDDAEPYKCYVQAPFIRYSFTDKLNVMSGGGAVDTHTPLFGNLVEATVISEYQQSHDSCIRFARTHAPIGSTNLAEIDLVDLDSREAYEVKLTSGQGYRGFSLLSEQVDFEGFNFTILEGDKCMNYVYEWGSMMYR